VKRIILYIVAIILLFSGPVTQAGALDAAIICLDPGHGGIDPGAVYQFADGTLLKEAEINLDISLALKTLLEQSGHQVVMTRTDSTHLTTQQRSLLANAAKANILVSIHTNSIQPEIADRINGALTLYNKETDKPLATAVQSALQTALLVNAPDPSIFLDFGIRTYFSRVMRRSDMPAIMVEPLFMSHPQEAAKLASAIQRDQSGRILENTRRAEIAFALYRGILTYLDAQRSTAGKP
jgi:N-acetylmuramoyl-L-alanine amidase